MHVSDNENLNKNLQTAHGFSDDNLKDLCRHLPEEKQCQLRNLFQQYRQLQIKNDELIKVKNHSEKLGNRYTILFKYAPIGYFIFDTNGFILSVNLAGADMVSSRCEDMLGKSLAQYLDRESIQMFNTHTRCVFDTKVSQICELILHREDGSLIFVQMKSTAFLDEEGVYNQFHSAVTDITEQKKAYILLETQRDLAVALENLNDLDQLV